MANKLQIGSGVIVLDIVRDGEPAGQIRFNPENSKFRHAVAAFMLEYESMATSLMSKAEALDKDTQTVALPNGMQVRANAQQILDLWDERDAWVIQKFDSLFGANASQVVFGDEFSDEALEAFMTGISPHVDKASKKAMSRYAKK